MATAWSGVRSLEIDGRALLDFAISMREDQAQIQAELSLLVAGRKRLIEDDWDLDYLFISELIDYLLASSSVLGQDDVKDLKMLKVQSGLIGRVRNAAAHSRVVKEADLEAFLTVLRLLESNSWKETTRFLKSLGDGVLSVVDSGALLPGEDKVVNNVPGSTFDDTTLVGRDSEIAQIIEHLKNPRIPLVSLIGPGGLGKTAVALQVVYDLLESDECPYELILWTSLKTEMLTPDGIESVSSAVTDLFEAVSGLGRVLDTSFTGEVKRLAELLDGLKVLLVIDNYETNTGADFEILFELLPSTVDFLVTSRQGVGAQERRVLLKPLDEKKTLHLLNRLIAVRDVPQLKTLSASAKEQVVNNYGDTPLALKWFVLSVEAGKTMEEIQRRSRDVLNFCVGSVFESLEHEHKRILMAIRTAARPVSLGFLRAILEYESIDELTPKVQFLRRCNLIIQELNHENYLDETFSLTDISRKFIDESGGLAGVDTHRFALLKTKYLEEIEANKQDRELSVLNKFSIRVRTESDEPAVTLLRRALRESRARETAAALATVQEARRLNPEFLEVDRVEAQILSHENEQSSEDMYLRVLAKSGDETQRGVVYYYLADLYNRTNRVSEFVDVSLKAESLLGLAETKDRLGQALARAKRFDEAFHYFSKALQSCPEGRTRKIIQTNLAKTYERKAVDLFETRNPQALPEIENNLEFAFQIIDTLIYSNQSDSTVFECLFSVVMTQLRVLQVHGGHENPSIVAGNLRLSKFDALTPRLYETLSRSERKCALFTQAMSSLVEIHGDHGSLLEPWVCLRSLSAEFALADEDSIGYLTHLGSGKNGNRLGHFKYQGETYIFFEKHLPSQIEFADLAIGQGLRFVEMHVPTEAEIAGGKKRVAQIVSIERAVS